MVTKLRRKWSALREQLRGGYPSPGRLGQSVALGFFVGTLPLYGLQTVLGSALGFWLGLDVLVVALASNISLPPFIPVLLYLDLTVGSLLVRGEPLSLRLSEVSFGGLSELGLELALGSLVVSIAFAAIGYVGAYAIGRRFLRPKPEAPAAEPLPT